MKKALFSRMVGEKIDRLIPCNLGLSNDHYMLNDRFLLRAPKADRRPDSNFALEMIIEKQCGTFMHPSLPLFYHDDQGYKVTPYRADLRLFNPLQTSVPELQAIAEMLSRMHHLPIKDLPLFDPVKRLKQYRLKAQVPPYHAEEKIITAFLSHPLTSVCLCHHDLVAGNLVYLDGSWQLIDFEYAALDDPYFDLASFLSENNLIDHHEYVQAFLSQYLGRLPTLEEQRKLQDYLHFLDLLWSYWAHMMKIIDPRPIYQAIIDEKTNRLDSSFPIL